MRSTRGFALGGGIAIAMVVGATGFGKVARKPRELWASDGRTVALL